VHPGLPNRDLLRNERHSVAVLKKNLPGGRQRFNLAHELGHLVLQVVCDLDHEKAAYHFAGAFLVPEPVVRFELGTRRQQTSTSLPRVSLDKG
jgi:Zn-dependent peptidase ImmA (M78 family)